MSTIQETINRLRELDQKASPTPWIAEPQQAGEDDDPDLEIIVEARNAIPVLLAEIDRLTAENQELKRENHLAWSKGHAAGWDCHIVTMQSADLLPKDQKTSSPYQEKK